MQCGVEGMEREKEWAGLVMMMMNEYCFCCDCHPFVVGIFTIRFILVSSSSLVFFDRVCGFNEIFVFVLF